MSDKEAQKILDRIHKIKTFFPDPMEIEFLTDLDFELNVDGKRRINQESADRLTEILAIAEETECSGA
jgi:hypothetical protein